MERNFMELLRNRWKIGRFLSVGLDSDMDIAQNMQLPWSPGEMSRETQFIFNRAIIDATHRWACAYKPNFAFYASEGTDGLYALEKTIAYIHEYYPAIPVILDGKWSDIGNTAKKYAKMAFDVFQADGVTVNPYLGREGALEPFLERSDKGIFVLARTSNPGAEEFQRHGYSKEQVPQMTRDGMEMYEFHRGEEIFRKIARTVSQEWNIGGNCGVVMGATNPGDIWWIRSIAPDLPILIPGIGAQKGDLEDCIRAARKKNVIINASRSVIFASKGADFAEAASKEARRIHRRIRKALKGGKKNDESPSC